MNELERSFDMWNAARPATVGWAVGKIRLQIRKESFHLRLWSVVMLLDGELEALLESGTCRLFGSHLHMTLSYEDMREHPVGLGFNSDLKVTQCLCVAMRVELRFGQTESRQTVAGVLVEHALKLRDGIVAHLQHRQA